VVDPEGDGVPLDHSETVGRHADTLWPASSFLHRPRYKIVDMATRQSTPQSGRPSKGDRWPVMTRLPVALEPLVRERAEDEDLSFSEVIANAVAAYFGQPVVAGPRRLPDERLIA